MYLTVRNYSEANLMNVLKMIGVFSATAILIRICGDFVSLLQ